MATTNKENNYNIDAAKKNVSTGTLINNQSDLQRYGIDYSQAQRDEIANIFANQAAAAYGKASNEYAGNMAQQQSSLQDTIRRSQAQAVATGASRGMQAANELSNLLGFQQEAAKGATELQGSYAEALANAQQQAMDVQNARAQIGAEIAAADIAGEAQKYSVGMDYQINDPYRVLSEIANLRAQGDTAGADALMAGWLSSQGASDAQTNKAIAAQKQQAATTLPEKVALWGGQFKATGMGTDAGDVGENFDLKVGKTKYGVELGSKQAGSIVEAATSNNVPMNTPFIYEGKIYIRNTKGVYRVGGRGTSGVNSTGGDYQPLYSYLETNGFILK